MEAEKTRRLAGLSLVRHLGDATFYFLKFLCVRDMCTNNPHTVKFGQCLGNFIIGF